MKPIFRSLSELSGAAPPVWLAGVRRSLQALIDADEGHYPIYVHAGTVDSFRSYPEHSFVAMSRKVFNELNGIRAFLDLSPVSLTPLTPFMLSGTFAMGEGFSGFLSDVDELYDSVTGMQDLLGLPANGGAKPPPKDTDPPTDTDTDRGLSTGWKILIGVGAGLGLMLVTRKRSGLLGLRADKLQLPTTGHIEKMSQEAERFAVVKQKFSEDLRDNLCISAHRRFRDLLKIGGRIESHAQSVGLPAEMDPFLEQLKEDLDTAQVLFDQGCRISRKAETRRRPGPRQWKRTGV